MSLIESDSSELPHWTLLRYFCNAKYRLSSRFGGTDQMGNSDGDAQSELTLWENSLVQGIFEK